jgi:hypothetical protein
VCFVVVAEGRELLLDALKLLIGDVLEPDEVRACLGESTDQLVQLELQDPGVAVLRVLEQEDHQERADRRSRRRQHEPRVRPVDDGPEYEPYDAPRDGERERPRRPHETRRATHEREQQLH